MKPKTFTQISHLWLEDKRKFVKKSTFAAYSYQIENHLIPSFGELYAIDEQTIQDYAFRKLDEGLSLKTIKDRIMILKMIMRFGFKSGYDIPQSIEVKYPKGFIKQKVEVLSITNQKKILDYSRQNLNFKNLGLIICLSTGMRIGELCALKWEDIDLSTGVIRINKTIQRVYLTSERKTELIIDGPKSENSIREIPMSQELIRLTKPLKKIVLKDNYVLTNSSNALEPRIYRSYLDKILATLGIPKIKFHALRHTFATRCIESGCDYKTVSSLLGHANISTTLDLYVHPNVDQKRKCINKMMRGL